MRFQLDLTITEEDYLAFNNFHSLRSKTGKRMVMRSRILFIVCIAVLMVLAILVMGWTPFSTAYLILMVLFTALYTAFFGKIISRNIKKQLKQLKKTGKLPYEPTARLEFYEDKLVEITPDKRTELNYSALERICIDADRFIYLYNSSVGAYILPAPQVRAQLDQEEFLRFLSEKCKTFESY